MQAAKFLSTPYYEILDYLVPFQRLTIVEGASVDNKGRCVCSQRFVFDVRYDQNLLLSKYKEQKASNFNIRCIIRFCKINEIHQDEHDIILKDNFPLHLHLDLNNTVITLPYLLPNDRFGKDGRRFPRPVDITDALILSPSAINRLIINWVQDEIKNEEYCFAMYVVRLRSSEELISHLYSKNMSSVSKTMKLIYDQCGNLNGTVDDEVMLVNTFISTSLSCPVSRVRITVPLRGKHCHHVQCFDAMTYIVMNFKKPTWLCPVCDKPALYNELEIDGLLYNILNDLRSKTAENIQFNKSGHWRQEKSIPGRGTDDSPFFEISQYLVKPLSQDKTNKPLPLLTTNSNPIVCKAEKTFENMSETENVNIPQHSQVQQTILPAQTCGVNLPQNQPITSISNSSQITNTGYSKDDKTFRSLSSGVNTQHINLYNVPFTTNNFPNTTNFNAPAITNNVLDQTNSNNQSTLPQPSSHQTSFNPQPIIDGTAPTLRITDVKSMARNENVAQNLREPKPERNKCPNYSKFCAAIIHDDSLHCRFMMTEYYGKMVCDKVVYACPTCCMSQMTSFDLFIANHGHHLGPFKPNTKDSIIAKVSLDEEIKNIMIKSHEPSSTQKRPTMVSSVPSDVSAHKKIKLVDALSPQISRPHSASLNDGLLRQQAQYKVCNCTPGRICQFHSDKTLLSGYPMMPQAPGYDHIDISSLYPTPINPLPASNPQLMYPTIPNSFNNAPVPPEAPLEPSTNPSMYNNQLINYLNQVNSYSSHSNTPKTMPSSFSGPPIYQSQPQGMPSQIPSQTRYYPHPGYGSMPYSSSYDSRAGQIPMQQSLPVIASTPVIRQQSQQTNITCRNISAEISVTHNNPLQQTQPMNQYLPYQTQAGIMPQQEYAMPQYGSPAYSTKLSSILNGSHTVFNQPVQQNNAYINSTPQQNTNHINTSLQPNSNHTNLPIQQSKMMDTRNTDTQKHRSIVNQNQVHNPYFNKSFANHCMLSNDQQQKNPQLQTMKGLLMYNGAVPNQPGKSYLLATQAPNALYPTKNPMFPLSHKQWLQMMNACTVTYPYSPDAMYGQAQPDYLISDMTPSMTAYCHGLPNVSNAFNG